MSINYWTQTSVVICVLVDVCCVAGFTKHASRITAKNSFIRKAGKVHHISDGTNDVTDRRASCPLGCSCDWLSAAKLSISCINRTTNVESLSHELDAYLLNFTSILTSLSMTDMPLRHLPESVCKLERLTTLLRLWNHPFLTKLPDNCFTRMHKLRTFQADYSGLTSLQDGLFDNLTNLVWVTFIRNNISSIGANLFDVTANLSSLTKIDITGNPLTEVDTWPLRRAQLINGSNIYLSYNRVSKFTNSLGWQYNCSSAPLRNSTINLNDNNITNLTDLLQGWNITGLYPVV